MSIYSTLKPEDVARIFSLFDTLESENPEFSFVEKNMLQISQQNNVDIKHLLTVLSLMDFLSIRQTTIDIHDIESISVRRKISKWNFKVVRTKGQTTLQFEHIFKL